MAWNLDSLDEIYLWSTTMFYALTGFHNIWYEHLSPSEKSSFVSAYRELSDLTIKMANMSKSILTKEMLAPLNQFSGASELKSEIEDITERYSLGSFGNFLNQYKTLTEIRKTDNPLIDMIDNIKGEA